MELLKTTKELEMFRTVTNHSDSFILSSISFSDKLWLLKRTHSSFMFKIHLNKWQIVKIPHMANVTFARCTWKLCLLGSLYEFVGMGNELQSLYPLFMSNDGRLSFGLINDFNVITLDGRSWTDSSLNTEFSYRVGLSLMSCLMMNPFKMNTLTWK